MFTGEVYARLNPDDPGRHWVRGGSLALAAVTGWLRVRAGRHYPTDVLAGAALGSLIGWLVPRLHEVDHPGGGADKAAPGLTFAFRF
jgi:membrane-associated phospholipid phosphatase